MEDVFQMDDFAYRLHLRGGVRAFGLALSVGSPADQSRSGNAAVRMAKPSGTSATHRATTTTAATSATASGHQLGKLRSAWPARTKSPRVLPTCMRAVRRRWLR